MKVIALTVVLCMAVAANALSKCEEHRLTATNGGAVGAYIPSCDEDGTYSSLQCHGSTGYCWCSDHDGTSITEQERGKYQSCECIRHKHLVEQQNLIGSFKPKCQDNGKYEQKQCWGSTGSCWCVNELTGEKTGENSSC